MVSKCYQCPWRLVDFDGLGGAGRGEGGDLACCGVPAKKAKKWPVGVSEPAKKAREIRKNLVQQVGGALAQANGQLIALPGQALAFAVGFANGLVEIPDTLGGADQLFVGIL